MSAHQAKRVAMAERLESTSGRSLAEWVEIANSSGAAGFMELIAWLKVQHDLGHFQARLVAEVRRDGGI